MENVHALQENIFITSDEKVTQNGIWAKCSFTGDILKNRNGQYAYKVILTTHNLLIKDGIQAIDDEFLEWFVQNPSCEEVDVVDNLKYFNVDELRERHLKGLPHLYSEKIGYKIIIPKEEPKQEKFEHILYKGNVWEPPVQETLEEVAERYYEDEVSINAFINGYKVAQKQFKNK